MQQVEDDFLSSTKVLDTSLASISLNTSQRQQHQHQVATCHHLPSGSSGTQDTGHTSKLIQSLCITPQKRAGDHQLSSTSDAFARLHLARRDSHSPWTGAQPSVLASPRFKSPARRSGTPSKPRTPSADRFIPNRSSTDMEQGNFLLRRAGSLGQDLENSDQMSPGQRNRQRRMAQLLGQDHPKRLFAFRDRRTGNRKDSVLKALTIQEDLQNFRSTNKSSLNRKISGVPGRVLGAPDIVNDYYLNPIDWSATNLLAVALANTVYIWNANTGEVSPLLTLPSEVDYVCSVKWTPPDVGGRFLAVGVSDGTSSLWDVEHSKKMRTLKGHSDRVSSMSWNKHILSSGSRSGEIMHSDVRGREHLVSKVRGHQREVCGLSWSNDGKTLASGGNDNLIKLWTSGHLDSAKSTLSEHQAAVKALAWCPWQNNLLASGAGTADRAIKIWNANNDAIVQSVDTKSQVCSLVWSENCHELASCHGFPSNGVMVWKYPGMTKMADLNGHADRVLALAKSPDGTTMVSAGADETLQLWKCFPRKEPTKTGHLTPLKKSEQMKRINRTGIR